MSRTIALPPEIAAARDAGALFVINHSAGKDSQAMALAVLEHVPLSQVITVHADLGEVEWPGCKEHIRATMPPAVPFIVAKPARGLLEMVEARGMFPDKKRRQCTSDLKRGPIEREIRRFLKANRDRFPAGLVVNCQGMRGEESADRAKLATVKPNKRQSVAGRTWTEWLPIHDWSKADVFARIAAAGQKPHPVYALGMSRLSCSFCIMAADRDLCTAARLRPDLFQRYAKLERSINHTLSMSRRTLPEITGIAIQD